MSHNTHYVKSLAFHLAASAIERALDGGGWEDWPDLVEADWLAVEQAMADVGRWLTAGVIPAETAYEGLIAARQEGGR